MDLCYIKLKVSGTTQVTCLTHILLTAPYKLTCFFVCLFYSPSESKYLKTKCKQRKTPLAVMIKTAQRCFFAFEDVNNQAPETVDM